MVQIRKGGGGGVGSGGSGSVQRSNSNKKHHHHSYRTSSSGMALFKLILLTIIAIQILFLCYKVVVVVLVPPSLSTTTSTTTNTKHNNVRHVSRSDIINSKTDPQQQQQPDNIQLDKKDNQQKENANGEEVNESDQIQQQNDVFQRFGTGPAREGYVVDLVGERQRRFSSIKTLEKLLFVIKFIENMVHPKHIPMVTTYISNTNNQKNNPETLEIHPCEYYKEPTTTSSTDAITTRILPLLKSECTTDTTMTTDTTTTQELYGYNSAPFVRYTNTDPCAANHHDHDNQQLQPVEPGMVISIPKYDPKKCDTTTTTSNTKNNYDVCMTHVFPFDIQNHDLNTIPPIIIYDATRTNTNDLPTKSISCDVPCQYDTNLHADIMNTNDNNKNINTITELGVYGTTWKIKQSLSDPYYNGNIKIERTDYRRDIYYSTTSFKSSIPLTYYNFETYNIRNTKAIDFHSSNNAATYLLNTNCGYGNRHKWVAAVQVVLNVEAYGSCQNNVKLSNGETIDIMEGRIQLMRKNRIVLAFEAGTDRDHITSIVWEALISGSVPAILGASNLEQHLPPHSAIFTTYYNSWDKFAAYVNSVANNETLWNTYQEWRTDEMALQKFEQRYAFVHSAPSPECRVCRWAYTKMYGLGFNHTTQVIQPTKLSRSLCTNKIANVDRITKPFRERWYVANDNDESSVLDGTDCTPTSHSADTIAVYGREMGAKYDVERTVVAHDGVIDITITKIVNYDPLVSGPLILRFEIDNVRNTDGASFRDVHTWINEATRTPLMSSISIQDEYAKVTIIANLITPIQSPVEGLIDIEISPGKVKEDLFESLRIRIILEDTNPIHDKLTEYFPSTYARRMMHDFIDPLELYYASKS